MNTKTYETVQGGIDAILRWDQAVASAIRRVERHGLDPIMRALTRAGDTPGWIVHGLVVFALLQVTIDAVLVMTAAGVLATLASQAAKRAFRRARPSASIAGFTARSADPDPFSFPSGHSTVAFAIATAAFATNPLLGVVELVLAAMISSSRVYLGAHYPVDVLGGIALGLACGLTAYGLIG